MTQPTPATVLGALARERLHRGPRAPAPLDARPQGRGDLLHRRRAGQPQRRRPARRGPAAAPGLHHRQLALRPPFPELYCDRRALRPGPPWSSLHAKCVAVDGKRAFLSSANFTSRGQERNIEAGALIHDATFAARLERQWLGLIKAGLVLRWDSK